jgi:hypothetical protein
MTIKVSNYSVLNGFQTTQGVNNKPIVGSASVESLVGVIYADLSDADTAGGVLALENDTDYDFYVDLSYIKVTTASSAACTIDVGVAANGTTSDDTIIDGLDVNSATGTFNNVDDAGTNGQVGTVWESGQFITASKASGAAAGLEGKAIIKIFKAE